MWQGTHPWPQERGPGMDSILSSAGELPISPVWTDTSEGCVKGRCRGPQPTQWALGGSEGPSWPETHMSACLPWRLCLFHGLHHVTAFLKSMTLLPHCPEAHKAQTCSHFSSEHPEVPLTLENRTEMVPKCGKDCGVHYPGEHEWSRAGQGRAGPLHMGILDCV